MAGEHVLVQVGEAVVIQVGEAIVVTIAGEANVIVEEAVLIAREVISSSLREKLSSLWERLL